MGSIQLDCPLCCGEKFSNHQSLKYHLLSMTVNLYCPACNQLCDNFQQIIDHLDSECSSKEEQFEKVVFKQEPSDETTDSTLNERYLEEENRNNEDESDEVVLDKLNESELQENSDSSEIKDQMQTVILKSNENQGINGSVVISGEDGEQMEVIEISENVDQEFYSCSSCGVNFVSVMDHIQEYHDGQEVVVEMTENDTELPENTDDTTLVVYPVEQSEILTAEHLEEEYETEEEPEEVQVKYNPQILNTLKQEDCIDKDGRLYTRKVVQIEKFWDDNLAQKALRGANRRQAIVEHYAVDESGMLTKATKDQIEEDKNVDEQNTKLVKLFNCSRCKMQFSKISQFNRHTCDPEKTSEYACSLCVATFSNPKSLCAHMKVHKINRPDEPQAVAPFLCYKCDTVFPTNKSLRLHQRMHEPIKAKEIEAPVEYGITGETLEVDPNKPREMFVCGVCNKTYDKGYESVHMATHNGVNDYHCHICNRKFFTQENLKMHMRVHNGGKLFSCTYCKATFESNEKLSEHTEIHSKDRPYRCGYCGRKFARPHEKVKHERIHTGERPHECEICGKTFRVSYCLTLHMRTHTGARPYVCKQCGKRFKAHSVYNHHLLTHSDSRNYKCPFCPKAFKTGVQLAGHKNSHTKPFSCTECNRPFASLYAVRAHMESHKRENNLKFSCYLCGASYARNFALKDHIKEVHHNDVMIVDTEATDELNDKIGLVDLEGLKATTSILQDDETEMALNQLRDDIEEEVI